MDEKKYRASFDSIRFSEDFQERTLELLSRQVQQELSGKELSPMKRNTWKKAIRITAIACALALVLSISAIAVSNLLKPADALNELGMFPGVAQIFQDESAVLIDESAVIGEHTVHLLGMAPGSTLSTLHFDNFSVSDTGSTYVMVAITRNDGAPMGVYDLDPEEFGGTMHCQPQFLVSGYHPSELRFGTSGGGGVLDGVYYLFYATTNLEAFADHTVYLAFHDPHQIEDVDPDNRDDPFVMAEDGSFSFRESYSLPHALFVLPLDPSKADPEAAEEIIRIKQEAAAMEKAETEARIAAEKNF